MRSGDARYDAVIFDLLTALIDSWSLWNDVAGSEEAGFVWRGHYLEITYGCGPYRPYETLVREAAVQAGLTEAVADDLERRWDELSPWDDAPTVLDELRASLPIAAATNCSVRMGHRAVNAAGFKFDVIVTAEQAGFYKPRSEMYCAVLKELQTDPARTLFVAGSASDVPGAKAVGMPVYWHNRVGLPPRDDAQPDWLETTLMPLLDLVFPSHQRKQEDMT